MKQCFWKEHKEREHLKDVICGMETLKFILYGKYMYLYTVSIWNNHFYTGTYFSVHNCLTVIINPKVAISNMSNDKSHKTEHCAIFNVSLIHFLYTFVIG